MIGFGLVLKTIFFLTTARTMYSVEAAEVSYEDESVSMASAEVVWGREKGFVNG